MRERVLIRRKSHAIISRILYICTAWRIFRRKLRSSVRTAIRRHGIFIFSPITIIIIRACIYVYLPACLYNVHTRPTTSGNDRVNDGSRARSSILRPSFKHDRRHTRKRPVSIAFFSIFITRRAFFTGISVEAKNNSVAMRFVRARRDDDVDDSLRAGRRFARGPGRVRAAALPAIAAPAYGSALRPPVLRFVHRPLLV